MKVYNDLSGRTSSYTVGFKSERTDRAAVAQLKTGENAILENTKIKITNALNNLCANPTKSNIKFLLDIADNMNYGEFGNAKFKAELDKDNITSENRENTDWNTLLKDTIQKSISTSKDDVTELKSEFDRVFAEKNDLSAEQKELLNLRKDLTKSITNPALLKSEERVLGHFSGFEIVGSRDQLMHLSHYYLKGAYKYPVEISSNSLGNIIKLENVLKGITNRRDIELENINKVNKQIEQTKEELQKPFSKAQELKDLLIKKDEIYKELGINEDDEQIICETEENVKQFDMEL